MRLAKAQTMNLGPSVEFHNRNEISVTDINLMGSNNVSSYS